MNPDPPANQPGPRDDGLEWLREIRREISLEFNQDQSKIGDAIRQREAEVGQRLVRSQPRIVPVSLKGDRA